MSATEPPWLQTARRLATALDAENYEVAEACLAADCAYHGPAGTLNGPAAIIASYRDNAVAGRQRFDSVEYVSLVESVGAGEALVTYTDRVRLGDRSHEFRCRQFLRVGAGGLVEEIRHMELPGERERLAAFETPAGA
jgi:hypothetical protein